MKRDLSPDQAFVLAGVCVAAVMLRGSPHSQRFSPLLVLLPGLVLAATRSTRVFGSVMTPAWLAARLWLLGDAWPAPVVLAHVFVAAAAWWIARGLCGFASAAFLIVAAGWFPLWSYTGTGHAQEAAGAAGLLAVYLVRTRWSAGLGWQRVGAGMTVGALVAWGGSAHVALLALTLSAFLIIQAPLWDSPE